MLISVSPPVVFPVATIGSRCRPFSSYAALAAHATAALAAVAAAAHAAEVSAFSFFPLPLDYGKQLFPRLFQDLCHVNRLRCRLWIHQAVSGCWLFVLIQTIFIALYL
jgi:hypothetical protein